MLNPNEAMVWYNYACYLALSGRIDEGLEALKRSIEIDINYAKKSVRDRDFESARAEEGFRRLLKLWSWNQSDRATIMLARLFGLLAWTDRT